MILDLQRRIDEDTRDVLHVAGARMDILPKDRSHFLHQGPKLQVESKVPMIQQKKMILDQLLAVPDQGGHLWQPYRTGVRCQHCRHRLHSKSLLTELRPALTSACEQAVPVTPSKKTRFEVINDLISAQQGVQQGVHHLRLDKAYLRCSECKSYILARCREDAFASFVGSPCHVGLLQSSEWTGHPSHLMMRQGSQLTCSRCGGKAKMADGKIQLNDKLTKRCVMSGATEVPQTMVHPIAPHSAEKVEQKKEYIFMNQ